MNGAVRLDISMDGNTINRAPLEEDHGMENLKGHYRIIACRPTWNIVVFNCTSSARLKRD